MSQSFIGRQAIYDRSLGVFGYELLYRSGATATTAEFVDGDQATARVLASAFLELGAERLVGDSVCFVNLTEGFLTGKLPLPLPPDRVVVEVLEHVLPTPAVVEGVRELREQGVRVAMDDYIHREENAELLKLCDFVKIDLRAQSRDETEQLVQILRPFGVKLLAEKVETLDEMKFCQDLGFDYFQGFFLTKPEVVGGKQIPANRVALLRLLAKLLDPTSDVDELGDLIGQDVSLAYRLLKYANSAKYGPKQEITSINQTLMMLGLKAVRKIVSLIVLVDLDERPGDLLPQSLVRAKMCEQLAMHDGKANPAVYYTAGLLSTLDALTSTPMERVLKFLPLSSELSGALRDGEGDVGSALECVRAFERGDWSHANYNGLAPVALSDCFADGVEYSRDVWSSLPRDDSRRKAG